MVEAGRDPEKERALVDRMRSLLQPFVLRRLKSELKDQLVDKDHVMVEVRGAQGYVMRSPPKLEFSGPAAARCRGGPSPSETFGQRLLGEYASTSPARTLELRVDGPDGANFMRGILALGTLKTIIFPPRLLRLWQSVLGR